MVKKTCLWCYKEFEAKAITAKYCCVACANAFHLNKNKAIFISLACEYCGKEYRLAKNRKKTRFCCSSCARKHANEMLTKERKKQIYEKMRLTTKNGKTEYEKRCQNCGEMFKTTAEKKKCCSGECAKTSKNRKEREIVCCGGCGANIEVIKGNPKGTKFCSHECASKVVNPRTITSKKCKYCNVDFEVFYDNKNKEFCSISCSKRYYFDNLGDEERKERGHNISKANTGRILSEEHKEKIRVTLKGTMAGKDNPNYGKHPSEEARQRMSDGRKGEKNAFYGKKHTRQTREKLSRDKADQWLDGKYNGVNPNSRYKRGWHSSQKTGRQHYYRSGTEKQFFELLDSAEDIVDYISEPFRILYRVEYETNNRNYIPDLLITYKNGTKKLVEIKPKYLCETKKNQAKFAAAKAYCDNCGILYEVWTEDNLKLSL